MNTPKHILLVDDNADIRLHLGNLLLKMGYRVEALERPADLLARTLWPREAVVMLDMRMPELSGLQVQRALGTLATHLPIVFISGESRPQEIVEAMKACAVDFLIKPFGVQELREALERAFARAQQMARDQARRYRAGELLRMMSPREQEVLPLLLSGHSNRGAAQLLGVKADTVKKHRASVYEKAMVEDLTELIALFEGVPLESLDSRAAADADEETAGG